ncbi:hypothetical protein LX36DRAFT_321576 [Colletotrichum falcatum]|nr:hypothetical protein LX36DRAFT_321576 [Colletotrichum falcatum]
MLCRPKSGNTPRPSIETRPASKRGEACCVLCFGYQQKAGGMRRRLTGIQTRDGLQTSSDHLAGCHGRSLALLYMHQRLPGGSTTAWEGVCSFGTIPQTNQPNAERLMEPKGERIMRPEDATVRGNGRYGRRSGDITPPDLAHVIPLCGLCLSDTMTCFTETNLYLRGSTS